MMIPSNTDFHKVKFQKHAVVFKRRMAALVAFSTTVYFLCLENVKAFTSAPLSSNVVMNENTLLLLASGAHSLARCWNTPSSTAIHLPSSSRTSKKVMSNEVINRATTGQRLSLTSLRMALGFGAMETPSSPEMLDMKTSFGAFGSWYNTLDPVARPPVYEDEMTDYSFSSPADSWPTYPSFSEDTTLPSTISSMSSSSMKKNRLRPMRSIRKITGWVLGGAVFETDRSDRRSRSTGFGSSQTII